MDIVPAPTSGDAETDALVEGPIWAGTSLTFGFPTLASQFTGYTGGEPAVGFEGLNAVQQSAVRAILASISSFTNLTFSEAMGVDAGAAVLRFGMTDVAETAHAYLPAGTELGGDSWYNNSTGDYDEPVVGNEAWFTFLHEIGHTLGLGHPHEATPAMVNERDAMPFTVMSYRSGSNTGMGYTNGEWDFAQSFMMEDIAALQFLYGANFGHNSSDNVYRWDSATGEMFIDGVGQGQPGANQIYMTLWDGGGTDTFDFSNYSSVGTISLDPGNGTTLFPEQRPDGFPGAPGASVLNALLHNSDPRSLIENVIGSSGSDTIYGNSAANHLIGGLNVDFIYGGAGDDIIEGGEHGDRLHGNDGNDVIYGGGHTDYLEGGPGDDVLDGGESNDDLRGGDGSDYASYASSTSGVSADLAHQYEQYGAGWDVYLDIENLIGSAFADWLAGNGATNYFVGAGGADELIGRGGADWFHYNTATDSLAAQEDWLSDFEHGTDTIDLRAIEYWDVTYDVAADSSSTRVTVGTAGPSLVLRVAGVATAADFLFGTLIAAPGFALSGTAGDDSLFGGAGADTLDGLAGDDYLDGGGAADHLTGGDGNDVYVVDHAGDLIVELAGGGFDRVYALTGYALAAGVEVEIIAAGGPDVTAAIDLAGNEFTNNLWANNGANALLGYGGIDNLFGYGGDDYLDGGTGADFLVGGGGNDILVVDNPGDVVVETAGEGTDTVYSSVDYTLAAGQSIEIVAAGGSDPNAALNLAGNELANNLWGNAGGNLLSGAGGDDAVFGFGGNDTLFGGDGRDLIAGGAGDDNLYGGNDADILLGDAGADSFLFNTALGPVDTLGDFAPVDDLIALDDAVFAGLTPGALAAGAFVAGNAAADADDRVIYDAATGALWFDADGNGAGAAVQFATLGGSPALTASDFLIF